ncbi:MULTISPECIES: hypothetical protein [unclassified Mucilaginibacter]|uniref:hypothetical protein n=1 Tax=unclassified Mucilaginibacter TaxID=2617802 RepID=UPI0031F6BE62
MEDQRVITGSTEQEVFAAIEADLTSTEEEILSYDALINHGSRQIELYIDIDLGGGFEGGSETTQLSAPLSITPEFKFAVHDEDFLDSIGSFFGLDSVKTGYPDLDEHVIIKTNHEPKVRELFADPEVRQVLSTLEDFDLGIHHRALEETGYEQPFLELNINQGLIDPAELRLVYHAFYTILTQLES